MAVSRRNDRWRRASRNCAARLGRVLAIFFLPAAICAQVPEADVYINVQWSVFHEGCRIFMPNTRGDRLGVAEARECLERTQSHNQGVQRLIAAATDAQISGALTAAAEKIPAEYNLPGHFEWVAIHEKQLSNFLRLAALQEFEPIRQTYAILQDHNANARNLLAAVSDDYIDRQLDGLAARFPTDASSANPLASRPTDRVALIGLKDLTLLERDKLRIQVALASPQQRWRQARVAPAGAVSLEIQVAQLLGVHPQAVSADDLTKLSRISQQRGYPIATGIVLVPPIPPIASTGQPTLQRYDLSTAELGGDVSRGNTLAVSGPPGAIAQLLATVRGTLPSATLPTGPTMEIVSLLPAEGSALTESRPWPTTSTLPTSSVPAVPGPRYFVLDFFKPRTDGRPAHGCKVIDVIQARLREAGASALWVDVIPVELQFFANTTQPILGTRTPADILNAYIASAGVDMEQVQRPVVDRLLALDPAGYAREQVPILYLQALYSAVMSMERAAVISSSFTTASSPYSVLPDEDPPAGTLLLSAVLDDQVNTISNVRTQPQLAFYRQYRGLPLMLVGGLLSDGTSFGTLGTGGAGVSCVGRATGWSGACIKPTEPGTSFATPEVASVALIDRAKWSPRYKLKGTEWRTRLQLAAGVEPKLADYYAAPGIPRLSMLGEPGTTLISGANQIQVIALKTGTVTFRRPAAQADSSLPLGRAAGEIRGLQCVAGRWYIFDSAVDRWEPVDLKNLEITLADQSKLGVEAFGPAAIREVIVL